MKRFISCILNFVLSFTRIDDNKIMFESGRNKVDDNPFAVYKYIVSHYPDKFKTVWLVEKGVDVFKLKKGDYFFYRTLKGYYHLATSKYWIRSQSLGSLVKKRKGQSYIQLWHTAGAFKKCGYDINNEANNIEMDHVKDWDYYVASDQFSSDSIISSTGYKKQTLILGGARTDLIKGFDDYYKNKVLYKLGIINNTKPIILYAPTFRDKALKTKNFSLKIRKLIENEDYLFIIRLHPLVNENFNKEKLNSRVINASSYADVNDLLIVADVLITDYSSSIFDFALLQKPMIFYPYDYNEYIEYRGGFYLDYMKDLPGPIAYTEQELLGLLDNIDTVKKDYKEKIYEFNEKYNKLNDGHVCERIVKELLKGSFKMEI